MRFAAMQPRFWRVTEAKLVRYEPVWTRHEPIRGMIPPRSGARTDQSFLVPRAEIVDNDYDLSINRYKEVVYEAVEYDPPKVILGRLAELEEEITKRCEELEELLG